MTCPLCNHNAAVPSWVGSVHYKGKGFPYLACISCESLYCDPMPDTATLAQMYGPEYAHSFAEVEPPADTRDFSPVTSVLKTMPSGTFIDFGCGGGHLLMEAQHLHWRAYGIEFDEKVAKETEIATKIRVFAYNKDNLIYGLKADVLHLGDVLEHLTDLNHQMPEILSLIKPGGLLIAQGPLENNSNLYTWVVRSLHKFRRKRRIEMAPYHVLLATAKGQRSLFCRFGLEEIEFQVHEVAWPAPDTISLSVLKTPRLAGLYALRRISQMISTYCFTEMGNRYFYIGRKRG